MGAVDLTPGPNAGRPFVTVAHADAHLFDDSTTLLRPVGGAARRTIRPRTRRVAVLACLVLGLGLLSGGAAGTFFADTDVVATEGVDFESARGLWHNLPADTLLPPVVKAKGAGPGGADRTWTRVAIAPDSTCTDAFDPLLAKALAPVGCERLLRATYTDSTSSHVTTVGMVFTRGDEEAMQALRERFAGPEALGERTDLIPRTWPADGTPAAGFGSAQRGAWKVSVLTDAPVVVYAVSGFADGRKVYDPQPAEEAVSDRSASSAGGAGLGNEAKGLADRVERALRSKLESES